MRVARDAVTADARPGERAEEAVRLGARREGDLDGIQPQGPAGIGELVGQGQRHRAEDVLIQLGRLRCLWGAHQVHGVGQLADYPGRPAAAFRGYPADHPRGLPLQMIRVARVDPLGAERHEHVGAGVQPALLKGLGEQFPGGAGVCRGGQDDRLGGPGVGHHAGAGDTQRREVGHVVSVDRGRHAHDHGVRFFHRGRVAGHHERAIGQRSVKATPVRIA